MQTFLPYESFSKSAAVLDRQRLGKQRVETWQILRALRGETKGWVNHPATRMWRGYEAALCYYGWVMCDEWLMRGYKDSMLHRFTGHGGKLVMPPWLGDEQFHLSHQSNLVRKLPDYYRDKFPGVPGDMEYVWPNP